MNRDQIIQWHQNFMVSSTGQLVSTGVNGSCKMKFHGFQRDCPDGLLDKKQFAQTYQKMYPQGKGDAYATAVFDVFDT